MRPDLEAALRLALSLPSNIHEKRAPDRGGWGDARNANHTRALMIGHRRYDSLADARRERGLTKTQIYSMIQTKKARYVK